MLHFRKKINLSELGQYYLFPQEQKHPCLNDGFRMSDLFMLKDREEEKGKGKLVFPYEI